MKKLLIFIIILFNAYSLYADFTIDVSADKRVISLNESVNLKITLVNPPGAPADENFFPKPEGLNVKFNGSQQMSQTQWINGTVTSEKKIIYQYEIVPQKLGVFKVGPFSANINGSAASSGAFTITVNKAPQRADPVILKTIISKKEVFIGEPFYLKIIFGYRPGVKIQAAKLVPIQISSAITELASSNNPPNVRKVYFGVEYITKEYDFKVIPNISGELEIPSVNFIYNIIVSGSNIMSDPFFKDFDIFSGTRVVQKTLRSEPEKIKVLPLPEQNKPAGFSGAVGNFKITSSINKTKLKVGEPVTEKVIINGRGNLLSVNKLNVKNAPDFKIYPEQLIEKESNKDKRVFEIVMVPIAGGRKSIPPVSFSFFNPDKKNYIIINSEKHYIDVTGTKIESQSFNKIPQSELKQTVKIMDNDIRFIKKDNELKNQKTLIANRIFIILIIIPICIYLLCLIYDIRTRRIMSDTRYLMIESAEEDLNKALKGLSKKSDNIRNKCSKLYSALTEYLSVTVLNKKGAYNFIEISDELLNRGVSNEKLDEIKKNINDIERIGFGYGNETAELMKIKSDVKTIIKYLEKFK